MSEMVDMGLRKRKGYPVYKTRLIVNGKVHYSEVDRLLVDRYGPEYRLRQDKKALEKFEAEVKA